MMKRHRKDEEVLERLQIVQAMFLTEQLGCPLIITGKHMVNQSKKADEIKQKPEEKEADDIEVVDIEDDDDERSQPAGKKSTVRKEGLDKKTFEKMDKSPNSD
jgi:phosphopantothenoylcysteine synthetase/decarboxylase